MAAITPKFHLPLYGVVFPVLAFLAASAGLAGHFGLSAEPAASLARAPVTVTIPAGTYRFRDHGEFYRNGFAVDAPKIDVTLDQPVSIMKHQVTEGAYGLCVSAGACLPLDPANRYGDDYPATGVSYDDAVAYARWLSIETGQEWSLPTYHQIAIAAGSRFPDEALGVDPDSRNPALRWLADYERETRRKAASDPAPKALGHYGENEFGLADFPGNVWEWTTTCQRRVDLVNDDRGTVSTCGIYVTVGPHNAPMSAFIRDPKSGGCSVGAPPANLGFRLIRDDRWYATYLRRLRDRGLIS